MIEISRSYLILSIIFCSSCHVNLFILDKNDLDIRPHYERDYLLVYLTSVPSSSPSENVVVGKEYFDTVYVDCYVVKRYVTKKTNQSNQWHQKLALEDGWINIDTTKLVPYKYNDEITRVAFTSNKKNYIKTLDKLYGNGQLILINTAFTLIHDNYMLYASRINKFNPSLLDSLEPALDYEVIED